MLGAKFWLVASGVALILLGIFTRWRTARYDLKDAATDTARTLARGERAAQNSTALENELNEITSQPTWTGKATRAAGTAAGHSSPSAGRGRPGVELASLALAAFGFFWA